MNEDLINDIALLPRTRSVKGYSLVFDPKYYTTEAEIQSSEFTAKLNELSPRERAEQLSQMCERVFKPANPDWDAKAFYDKLDMNSMSAAMRFFDSLRLGFVPAEGEKTTETPLEQTSPEIQQTPANIVPVTTKTARREKTASK